MTFYKLSKPLYTSSKKSSIENPIRSVQGVSVILPGMKCSVCGFWASSNRIRVGNDVAEKVSNFLIKNNVPKGLYSNEWVDISDKLTADIGINNLSPGAIVGMPIGEILGSSQNDIYHISPGQIWVTERVTEAILSSELKGVKFAEVIINHENGQMNDIRLWELVVSGKAMRVNSTEENLTVCKECGRKEFPNHTNLLVDEARWDGTDFFNVDFNPNIIIVTKRVVDVFINKAITNISFTEIT
jgi:ribosomal protein L37E